VRVVFLGNARWSVPSLEAVASSSHEIVRVVTRVPKPAGRGSKLTPTPVAESARSLGLALAEVDTVKSGPGLDALAEEGPDVLAVVAYGEILPPDVLRVARVAPVNVHFSLLPALRGAAPVQHAILNGLETTGVTTIRMDQGMDTGPILLQAEEPIREGDDAGSLGNRLAERGGRLLVETLNGLANGSIRERPQADEAATYAPKLTSRDRVIDWSKPAEDVVRQVRAMAPEPGAATTFRGKRLLVSKASVGAGSFAMPLAPIDPFHAPPGSFLLGMSGAVVVVAGDGLVTLEEVQPEGRRRMGGAEFARGYRPQEGEALGPFPEGSEGPG
jgi:methionyl-tRNA formyltransferase